MVPLAPSLFVVASGLFVDGALEVLPHAWLRLVIGIGVDATTQDRLSSLGLRAFSVLNSGKMLDDPDLLGLVLSWFSCHLFVVAWVSSVCVC